MPLTLKVITRGDAQYVELPEGIDLHGTELVWREGPGRGELILALDGESTPGWMRFNVYLQSFQQEASPSEGPP